MLVLQVLGAIAQFDEAMTVSKLRGARERKRRETGKCEGRKPLAEQFPEAVAMAKRLRRVGDLWRPVLGAGIDLPTCLERLMSLL